MADDKVWVELDRAHVRLRREHLNNLVAGDTQVPDDIKTYDPEACFRTLCIEDRELSHMLRDSAMKHGNMNEHAMTTHGDSNIYDGNQSRTQHTVMNYCSESDAFSVLMRYERTRSPVLFNWGEGGDTLTIRELSRCPKDILAGPFTGSGRFLSRVSKIGYKQGKMLRQLIGECRTQAELSREAGYDEEPYCDDEDV